MVFRIPNVAAIELADTFLARIDAGVGPNSNVTLYDGVQPATGDAPIGGANPLVVIPLPDPAFGPAADADPGATASIIGNPTAQATAAGVATWYRVFDKDGNPAGDGSVAAAAGAGIQMVINNTTIAINADVTINSWTHTQPEGA